ncbi:alpha/beta hydrolase [Streptomyces aureoverticillatus]|uniref:alpha/beta hydrolase n=1 Tax=Streptomyces aureoverticillatus TaxID=66871 RepID=UPI0013D9C9A2|nr:alpha/beta hydrolase-fold protein [Streptomyces aureoverticillatus]QIB44233.1 esterase family protein [Streptomyces aureoverticillatus]
MNLRSTRLTGLTAAALAATTAAALLTGCSSEKEKPEPVTFDNPKASAGGPSAAGGKVKHSGTRLPTGPRAAFTTQNTLEDGTKIGVTTLKGKKSGFTGKVWVWAPKQYFDPKYAHSGFPVLIALPGGPGYPDNYWMGTDLKLESSIAKWSRQGKSLPFIVVMPVLNPDDKFYYDGSDIPGQPKMGTWMTDDVPDFVKANFRTFKSRDGWGFMGSSSGGFVGLKSVLKYPDRFKAVIASGPDTVPDSPLWRGHEAERLANDPGLLAERLIARKGPEVDIALQVGTQERLQPNLRAFMKKYGKGPVKTRLNVIQGGRHSAHSYVPGMGNGPIQWISQKMKGPVADGG